MKIGTVIRKYRKDLGITQEEMANYLGVTAPAVNKWEKNNTLPDVTLLAPIARLLGITTDELLSFKEELTKQEINNFISQIIKDSTEKDFDDCFLSVKHKIEEYPNCEELIMRVVPLIQMRLYKEGINKKENYEAVIIKWYEQCLNSNNEEVRQGAAISLFNICYNKKDYEMALHYTKYLPDADGGIMASHDFMEAKVYSKNGRRDEAYKIFEEAIWTRYFSLDVALNELFMLYLDDGNYEMANKLVNIFSAITAAIEIGQSPQIDYMKLEIASRTKDIAKTEHIMRTILDRIGGVNDFMKSSLCKHIVFNKLDNNKKDFFGLSSVAQRKQLVTLYKDKKFDYMRGNEWWENLK